MTLRGVTRGGDVEGLHPLRERLGVWQENRRTGEVRWSDGLYRILGLEADYEPALHDYCAMVIADDRERLRQYEAAVAAGERGGPLELRLLHPDGRIRRALVVIDVSSGDDCAIEERLGVVVDVTERGVREVAQSASGDPELASQLLSWGRGQLAASPVVDADDGDEALSAAEHEAVGTVLVVDDHPRVRRVAAMGFEHLGYDVVEAADLAEARGQIEERPDLLLIFSDVVLPDGRGPELSGFLMKLGRRTACLFTSGYSEDALVQDGVLDDEVSLLNKPYTQDRLAEAVEQVVAGRRFVG